MSKMWLEGIIHRGLGRKLDTIATPGLSAFIPGPGRVWKDAAGTVPAMASGDRIARIDDVFGLRSFTQTDDTKCPTLAIIDGRWAMQGAPGHWLATKWSFSGQASLVASLAIEQTDDDGVAYSFRNGSGYTGLQLTPGTAARWITRTSVHTSGLNLDAPASYVGTRSVLTQTIGGGFMTGRRNGVQVASVAASGTLQHATTSVYIGIAGVGTGGVSGVPADDGSRPWSWRCYGAVFSLDAISRTPEHLAAIESLLMARTRQPRGITLRVVGGDGQSNYDGRGRPAEVGTPAWLTNDLIVDGVSVWNGYDLCPTHNLNHAGLTQNGSSPFSGGGAGRFGPRDVAAKLLADELGPITLCFLSNGDTALSPEFSTRGSWNADYASIAAGTPRLLELLEARWNAFVSWADLNDITIDLLAWTCMQGESDKDGTNPAAYPGRWAAKVARIRSFTGRPALPYIYAAMPVESNSYNATIRAAHIDFAANDPYATCLITDGYGLQDGVHLNEAAIVTLGTAMADAIKAYL